MAKQNQINTQKWCAKAFFVRLLVSFLVIGLTDAVEAAAEQRISTSNSTQALAELQTALADPEVETIVLLPPSSGQTALVLPDKTKLLATSAKRKTIQVEKPFMPPSGEVTISGDSLASPAASDYSAYRLFEIKAGSHVVISNVTLMGGFTGERKQTYTATCGGIDNYGHLEMYRTDMLRTGTALLNRPGARAVLKECNIVRNANWYGGGVLNFNSNSSATTLNYSQCGVLIMDQCSLTENQSLGKAHGGGAAENQGLMCLNNCILANNASTEIGGALNNCKGGQLYVMNSTLVGNVTTASGYGATAGGAIGNAGGAGNVHIVNSFMAYNGYDNGTEVDFSSLGRYTGSKDTPECSMKNTIFDAMDGIAVTITDENCSQEYDGLVYDIDESSIIAAGTSQGHSSEFPHPLLASADHINNPYALEPVMTTQPSGHFIFVYAADTFFDYSTAFESTPSILMAVRQDDGEPTALGSHVRAPNSPEEAIVTEVIEGFAGVVRGEPNFIGAVAVEVEGTDGPVVDDISLFWVQLGKFNRDDGFVSGVTIYRDTYRSNSVVTVHASPASAHYLDGWNINEIDIPDTAQQYIFSFSVTTNIVITPIFKPVETKIVSARQRYPWNNLIDIDYMISEKDAADYRLVFIANYIDRDSGQSREVQLKSFVRNSVKDASGKYVKMRLGEHKELRRAGTHRVTWDSAADNVRAAGSQMSLRLLACEGEER